MGQLLDSLARGTEPEISGRDNLRTMALVEAGYRSLAERRLVRIDEIHSFKAPVRLFRCSSRRLFLERVS